MQDLATSKIAQNERSWNSSTAAFLISRTDLNHEHNVAI